MMRAATHTYIQQLRNVHCPFRNMCGSVTRHLTEQHVPLAETEMYNCLVSTNDIFRWKQICPVSVTGKIDERKDLVVTLCMVDTSIFQHILWPHILTVWLMQLIGFGFDFTERLRYDYDSIYDSRQTI